MAFRVGQKVVCVFDGELNPSRPHKACWHIRQGEIYEIAWVGDFPCAVDFGEQAVRLCGIDRGPDDNSPEYDDYPFAARRFRPVVSTNTGMAILEQIRRDVTNKELRPIMAED